MSSDDTSDFAELEQRGWSEPDTAQAYAKDFAKAAQYSVPVMIDAVKAGPGTDLLDLCCGHGILSGEAVERGAMVTGVDFSPTMLDLSRSNVPHARFLLGDAMALPFDVASFDAVVIGFGIPHVPDPPAVFAEVKRVLKSGGRLAYSVWQDQAGALQYVFNAIAKHGKAGIALPPGPGAHDYADPDRARAALTKTGFTDIALTQVESRWQVTDPATPFDYFDQGTVRGGALLRKQPGQSRVAIRQAVIEDVLAHHGQGPVWDIPIPSVVVSARAS